MQNNTKLKIIMMRRKIVRRRGYKRTTFLSAPILTARETSENYTMLLHSYSGKQRAEVGRKC